MRLSRFFVVLMLATLLSLLYVWQQTEVVRLAYEGQKHYARFQDLLDENSSLRYNLTKNTSVTNMAGLISGGSDFKMPDNYCLVKVDAPQGRSQYAQRRSVRRETMVSRVFNMKRQAEAKTINTAVRYLPQD